MKVIDSILSQSAGIAAVRRDIHAHPERPPPILHRVEGVGAEVGDELMNLGGVAEDIGAIRPGAELDFDPRVSLFRGDHRLSPDRYSVHCTPQIHGALLDQLRRAWQSVAPESVEYHEATASPERHLANGASPALHRHQLPSACGVANLKAAIAALSSISERRLAKLLDPVRNHGLPASLVPNPDGNHYGLMVLRYRAAVLVGEISERAMPAGSSPTACRGKAHANSTLETTEPTSIDALCQALQSVLALERYAAVQALRVRMELFARVHGARLAPTPGEFALRVIEQFEGAGLTTVWDGRKLRDEIERVRGMLGV